MHGAASILILAKKKAAGPGGFFDPMSEDAGMAMGPMDAEMPKNGMFDNGGEEGESENGGDEESIQMLRANLQSTMSKARSVYDMVEGCEVPEWVKQKITLCDSYMDSVYDYLKFNPELGGEPTEEEEPPVPAKAMAAPPKKGPPAFLKPKPMN